MLKDDDAKFINSWRKAAVNAVDGVPGAELASCPNGHIVLLKHQLQRLLP